MEERTHTLLITKEAVLAEQLHQGLAQFRCDVRHVPDVGLALARIGGGGISAVVVDWTDTLSGSAGQHAGAHAELETLGMLRRHAPGVPLIVLGAGGDGTIRSEALKAHADAWIDPTAGADLGRAIHDAISTRVAANTPAQPAPPRSASVITLLGAKGGVGTTTVAWNLAVTLARRGTVILAEMHPTFGSLAIYMRPGNTVRRLATLLEGGAKCAARDMDSCLWRTPGAAELRILFGPQTLEDCREIPHTAAGTIVESLAGLADYVVLDMPSAISPALRVVLGLSDYLGVVVEREPLCLNAAKQMVMALQRWDAMPGTSGLVVVNRAPLAAPLPLDDIETQLGVPILKSIPPASDLCVQSQKARIPLVELDPESLAAQSLVALAQMLHGRRAGERKTA